MYSKLLRRTGAAPLVLLSIAGVALCGCQPSAPAPSAGTTSDSAAAAGDSAGSAGAVAATPNPAEYNRAISPDQRAKIQSHKDGG